jgi:Lipocalin-like domain
MLATKIAVLFFVSGFASPLGFLPTQDPTFVSMIKPISNSEKYEHKSERDRFIGAWRVVAISDTRPDGTEVPDLYLGPHPTGLLIYEASGYLCNGLMNPERAKWANPSKASKEELAASAQSYDTYCGTYQVDEQQKEVVHHLEISLDPNQVGLDLVRTYVFDGNRLKLSGTEGLQPGFKHWTVSFEKATPSSTDKNRPKH